LCDFFVRYGTNQFERTLTSIMTIEKDEVSEQFIIALEKHTGILVKISYAYARTYHEREDLINDIIFQLWKSFTSFKGQSKMSTWMYRVALNTCMNYDLKKKKETIIFSDDLTDFRLNEVIEINLTEQDQHSVLYDCINELDSFNKAIVLLYLDGNSHEEISLVTGISITNVGTRMGRIKEQLKKLVVNKY